MSATGAANVARLAVRSGEGGSYPVVIGAGASQEAPAHLLSRDVGRCAVVTDSNLEANHARAVAERLGAEGLDAPVVAFPAGEASKTRATKATVEDRLFALGLGRDGAIAAVGGGVVGDLAGFVAATYMRGIPVLQIPTTLLAMADASIGGKTGVDHPEGKNLVGAFHAPIAVLADTDFLATLPARELKIGLAEMVKAGVVADAALFASMEAVAADLARAEPGSVGPALVRAAAVKVGIVSADAQESGLRHVLNFGHTIGHALEKATGWSLTHGEAVSIGMVAESRIAVRLGLLSPEGAMRIESLLSALGLPVRVPAGQDAASILAAASSDKKRRQGRLRLSLPKEIGEMASGPEGWTLQVGEEEVLHAVAALLA
jgi:3-dehydroquinate synthase